MDTKLKSCPFCGGEAGIEDFSCWQSCHECSHNEYGIACKVCGAQMRVADIDEYDTGDCHSNYKKMVADTVEAWNRRVINGD